MNLAHIAHGIDTLEFWLNFGESYSLPDDFLEMIERGVQSYRTQGVGLGLNIHRWLPLRNWFASFSGVHGEAVFEACSVRPVKRYYGLLSWADEALQISFSRVTEGTRTNSYPQIHVVINGRLSMAAKRNIPAVVADIVDALEHLIGSAVQRIQVTRADLFADFIATDGSFELADLDRFVTRARLKRPFGVGDALPHGSPPEGAPPGNTGSANTPSATPVIEVGATLYGRRWSGFTFGRGDLMCRIYSKSVQAITTPSARLQLDEYGLDRKEHEVIRVEFQLRSQTLREMGFVEGDVEMRDFATLWDAMGAIWRYLTQSWLTLRVADQVQRLDARPLDENWEVVAAAFDAETYIGDVIRVKVETEPDTYDLMNQAVGCVTSALGVLVRRFPLNAPFQVREAWSALHGVVRALRIVHNMPKHLQSWSGFQHYCREKLALLSGVSLGNCGHEPRLVGA